MNELTNEEVFRKMNQLIHTPDPTSETQPPRPSPDFSKFWFATPETCDDPSRLPPLYKEIYDEHVKFQ